MFGGAFGDDSHQRKWHLPQRLSQFTELAAGSVAIRHR
jgi:hypothetical protein